MRNVTNISIEGTTRNAEPFLKWTAIAYRQKLALFLESRQYAIALLFKKALRHLRVVVPTMPASYPLLTRVWALMMGWTGVQEVQAFRTSTVPSEGSIFLLVLGEDLKGLFVLFYYCLVLSRIVEISGYALSAKTDRAQLGLLDTIVDFSSVELLPPLFVARRISSYPPNRVCLWRDNRVGPPCRSLRALRSTILYPRIL